MHNIIRDVTPFENKIKNAYAPGLNDKNQDQNLKNVAQTFEASFLAEMFKFAGVVKSREGLTSGGAGENAFSSLLTTQYAQEMSAHHSIGLAERIYSTLKERVNHD